MSTEHTERNERTECARQPRVAFQGEHGAFGEAAIHRHWPDGALAVPCASFADTLAHLTRGTVDFAVLPVENAIVGPVRPARDALAMVADAVEPLDTVQVPVQLCLMGQRGATIQAVREVHSHAVALAQCARWLAEHPACVAIPHEDTAGAARDVARWGDPARAAIASAAAAAHYGLDILAHGVQDRADNWTRFVVLRRRH